MDKVGIIGAGSWGTALSLVLANNGHSVEIWSIVKEEIDMLKEKHEHVDKLPGVKLPDRVTFTTDLGSVIKNNDILVLAVPSVYTRSTAKSMAPYVKDKQIIVCVAKGIEDETFMTISDVVESEIPKADVAVMCGPSHAEEVGQMLPTTVVAGARTRQTAETVQNLFMNDVFRVYTSPDVLGMELGGSLKNVIALGVTGIGDLIVTCESRHSRNRKAGMLMGQGYTMDEATKEVKMVVEGIYSAKAALALGKKYNVRMPIIEEVNKVLFEDKPAKDAVLELMKREKRAEHSELEWEN